MCLERRTAPQPSNHSPAAASAAATLGALWLATALPVAAAPEMPAYQYPPEPVSLTNSAH